MKAKISIGIIGCGWIVENAHIPAFSRLAEVNLSGIFDINYDRAKKIAEKFSIKKVYKDLSGLLDSNIDAVVIASPNFTHADYILSAIDKDKHVLCEKPFVLFPHDLNKIAVLNKLRNKIVLGGFVNRFRKDTKLLKSIIDSGQIGEINSIKAGWLRNSGMPSPGSWFTCKKYSGGGVLIDLGPHIIDLCLAACGNLNIKSCKLSAWKKYENKGVRRASWHYSSEVASLFPDVEDNALAQIITKEGIGITLMLSWNSFLKRDATFIRIKGTKGTLILKTLFGFSRNKLWKDDKIEISLSNKEVRVISFPSNLIQTPNAFNKQAEYFIGCIKKDLKTDNLLEADIYDSVNLIDLLYKSLN